MSHEHTFILVPGAWHGAAGFAALEKSLRATGAHATAVELTSQGDDAATIGDLYRDAAAVQAAVAAASGTVTLLGHSAYGGFVITEAAAGAAVDELVYLAAFAPEPGESMQSILAAAPAEWIRFADGLLHVAPGWGSKLFYSDCLPDVAADAEARLRPQSAHSFGQTVTEASWRRTPSRYLVCAKDQAIPPEAQRGMAARVGTTVELDSGHCPFLSQPDQLAAVLVNR